MAHPGFEVLRHANRELVRWAQANNLPVYRVENVATFEQWDDGIAVWVFFEKDSDLRSCSDEGTREKIRAQYTHLLDNGGYPFEQFPNVTFTFDSHENVQRHYAGSYFYRLR